MRPDLPALGGGLEAGRRVRSPTSLPRASVVVLVCHLGRAGYNVQRALSAMRIKSYLIHDQHARSVGWSRDCKTLLEVDEIALADENSVVEKINDLHRREPLLSVIATDVPSSLLISNIRARLLAPIFPIPDIDSLKQLDNKWSFAQLCLQKDVAIPKTLYFENNAAFDPASVADMLPVIIKPAGGFGQRNILILNTSAEAEAFREASSHPEPIVVQEIVEGTDWALSVFCRNGIVTHWVTWECPAQLEAGGGHYGVARFQTTTFEPNDTLIEMGRTLIAATNFSGIANFDARLDPAGKMVFFECNPRFFNRMLAARMCGMDFVAAGLFDDNQRATLSRCEYYPWQEMFTLRGWKLLISGHWKLRHLLTDLREMLHDPLPPVVRKLMHEDERAI